MDINHNYVSIKQKRFEIEAKKVSTDQKSIEDKAKNLKELKDACDGFEEIFVHKMLQVMREAGPKSDFISGGRGEEIFQDMLDENYAKLISQSDRLGLSKMIFEHSKKFI
jgi:peptidoglycan hydrolase FlgJ